MNFHAVHISDVHFELWMYLVGVSIKAHEKYNAYWDAVYEEKRTKLGFPEDMPTLDDSQFDDYQRACDIASDLADRLSKKYSDEADFWGVIVDSFEIKMPYIGFTGSVPVEDKEKIANLYYQLAVLFWGQDAKILNEIQDTIRVLGNPFAQIAGNIPRRKEGVKVESVNAIQIVNVPDRRTILLGVRCKPDLASLVFELVNPVLDDVVTSSNL